MNIGVFTDSFRPYSSGVVRSIELFSREYTQAWALGLYLLSGLSPYAHN
jgi:hypothetical protein